MGRILPRFFNNTMGGAAVEVERGSSKPPHFLWRACFVSDWLGGIVKVFLFGVCGGGGLIHPTCKYFLAKFFQETRIFSFSVVNCRLCACV